MCVHTLMYTLDATHNILLIEYLNKFVVQDENQLSLPDIQCPPITLPSLHFQPHHSLLFIKTSMLTELLPLVISFLPLYCYQLLKRHFLAFLTHIKVCLLHKVLPAYFNPSLH